MVKEQFDIFILAGQSNAEGRGVGTSPEQYVPRDDIYSLNANICVVDTGRGLDITYPDSTFVLKKAEEEIADKNEQVSNFALSFAQKYVEKGFLESGRKVLIIRAAVCGTGFAKGHWGKDDILFRKMLEMTDYALQLNPTNRLLGLLWHQGEHDAVEGNRPENFHQQLKTLFSIVRARYECPNLPIIAGDFCHDWKNKNLEICNPIVEEIQSVIEEMGNAAFVESDGLLSNNQSAGNGDDIHFCRDSLHILGKRYFEAYQKLR